MKLTADLIRMVVNPNASGFSKETVIKQILENQEKLENIKELIDDCDDLFNEDDCKDLFDSSYDWNYMKKDAWNGIKEILKEKQEE